MPFSDHRSQFSRDTIRQRMMQHVMHLWGLKNTTNLDPFVRLVIDTLANELNKISNEFIESEVGLLNRLAGLLTPDLLTVPRPAHAVMQAQPVSPTAYMAPIESLFVTRRFASKPYGELDSRHDLFLGAVDTVKLFSGSIACIATDDLLAKLDPSLGKVPIAKTEAVRKLPPQTLWLGLDLNAEITSLNRMGFYFNFPEVTNPGLFYDLIHLSRWSLNGQPLTIQPSLCYDPQPGERTSAPGDLSQLLVAFDIDQMLENDVKNTYRNRFIHLCQEKNTLDLPAQSLPFPADFLTHFSESQLSPLLEKPLLWIKVVFPAPFNDVVLRQLDVRINAFPVMNRRLHRLTYRTRVMHTILPLPVSPMETFLAMRSLIDSRNRIFTPYPFRQMNKLPTGSYAIRRSGIERFDPRDAHEHLHYLTEILRDESVAFAAYGHDTVQWHAQQLNRQISQLERMLNQQEGTVRELPHYLLVNPNEDGDTLEASYWTTDCEYGNNIQAGSLLQPFDITYLMNDQSVLLTTTTGGQNKLQSANKLDAYRYVLTSRERLVTTEDIRSFILVELGLLITDVQIRKGVAVGILPKEGLVRTIDIFLIPAPDGNLTDSEWATINESLRAKIISRSSQVSQYRIFRQ